MSLINQRPDLTYITQVKFIEDLKNDTNYILEQGTELPVILSSSLYKNACVNLPELVQCVEMLFDMTLSNPESMTHQIALKTLKKLEK